MSASARVLRDITFAEYPGFRPVSLDLHLPAIAGDDDRLPVVLVLHGGGWRAGRRDVFSPLLTEERSFGRIAAGGFAIVTADYRLSGEAHFPAQIDDVVAALRWIAAHADAHDLDASRIVLWGSSAGATLAALVAEQRHPGVVGVVGWYGPSDLLAMAVHTEQQGKDAPGASREDLWLGAPVSSLPEVATAASPALGVVAGLPPFHLAHGLDDTDVPPEQSEVLAAALRAAGVDVDLHLEPGAGHFWRGASDAAVDALFDRAIDFARSITTRSTATHSR